MHAAAPAVTREAWRLRATRGAAVSSTSSTRLELRETHGKGRAMYARSAFTCGEGVVREHAVLRGRCCSTGCPGCPRKTHASGGGHAEDCWWPLVEAQPWLSGAVSRFRNASASLAEQPPERRANFVRVCCLLAMLIQAAASESLRGWLLGALRGTSPSTDPESAIEKNTRGFARKFAGFIPAPPAAAKSEGGRGSGAGTRCPEARELTTALQCSRENRLTGFMCRLAILHSL